MTVAALTAKDAKDAKDAKEKQDRFRDSLASLAARGYGVNLATDAN